MTVTRSSLLMGVRQGESEHWKEFVRVYLPLIERMARAQGVCGSDVDDVAQEVLVKMLRVLPRFLYARDKGGFRPWLRRVVGNVVIDHRRSPLYARRCQSLIGEVPAPADCDEMSPGAFREHLVRCALSSVRDEVRKRTWQCFDGLMLQRRPAGEVSRELGVSENAVYINSSRVMSRVREYCAIHGENLTHASLAPTT